MLALTLLLLQVLVVSKALGLEAGL